MTKRLIAGIAAALSLFAPAVLHGAHVDVVPTSRITNQVASGLLQVQHRPPAKPLLTH